jgi:signal transduction histidine kinase
VKDLLDYSRGDRRFAREPVRVGQLVDDVESFGLAPLRTAGIVTVQRSIGADGTLVGDRRALSRALLNLVRNAAEAMPSGGTLTFHAAVSDGVARFVVSDTGPGIPEHILPTLFEPFATFGKAGGTGLGMAMTKASVDGHKGTITVETRPGSGTSITIDIPVSP